MSTETQPPVSGPDEAFAVPPGQRRVPVDQRLAQLRLAVIACYTAPGIVLGALLGVGAAGLVGLLAGVALVCAVAATTWGVAMRSARTWWYSEGEGEFTIGSGLIVRRLEVIPYGRLQFADVSESLLERWFGLATVRIHTAASARAYVPGLPADDAVRLRDRLTRRAEKSSMGL